ncbi:unnamed protein product [Fusarium graminearum]|nr:unnamed protein product [Fusarium graminearum]
MIGQIESVIHSVKLSFDVGSAYESLESKSGDVLKQKSLRKRGQDKTSGKTRVNGSSPGIWRAAAHSADDRLPIKKGEFACAVVRRLLSRVITCGVKSTVEWDARYPLRRRRRPSFSWSHSNQLQQNVDLLYLK